jgi:hypothetical protein
MLNIDQSPWTASGDLGSMVVNSESGGLIRRRNVEHIRGVEQLRILILERVSNDD